LKPAFDVQGHVYILLTLLFTVYGQMVIKWQIGLAGPAPDEGGAKLIFLLRQLLNPWIISGFIAAFVAAIAWMAAMTRFDLSYAYPFMSLAFVMVLCVSAILFGEPLSMSKIAGTGVVMAGLVLISR
jgi:multidrug transporter EmrE-like cation transporter